MSNTLYRKYRPQNFSEIIGQKHIIQTLVNSIKNERIGQAYLFTGPRGTGKTSVARILAKAINCANPKDAVSCEKCEACRLINESKTLDVIEIDAASNTGVDNIRELRETVKLQPTALKYKVYIIDEVHMLSMGAFNALLKTLEEPPAHVIFILATTEIHKVPETIISRCQRFDFGRLPIENIIEKLSLIAKKEKVKIDKASLEMIALSAEGGMRDAESILGQIISLEDKEITLKEVEEILGTTDRNFATELTENLISKNTTEAIRKINTSLMEGYDLQILAKSMVNYLRCLMLLKIDPYLKTNFAYEMTSEQIKKMLGQAERIELAKIILAINLFLEAQGKISFSVLPQLPLEIAIIRATQTLPAEVSEKIESGPVSPSPVAKQSSPEKNISNPKPKPLETEVKNDSETETAELECTLTQDGVQCQWKKLLNDIAPFNHSLKALLSNCQVFKVENQEITLATPYDFYRDKLTIPANRLTVEDVFGKILGSKIFIKVVLNKEVGLESKNSDSAKTDIKKEIPEEKKQNSLLASALEIIGGKVVEE
jgi:DNA polymerase-3 subunit gamma/tau